MREQRHRVCSNGSPSWRRSCERDPGIRESGRISPPCICSAPIWAEPDRSRLVPAREVVTSGGDVRSFYACESRIPESGEYRQNRYFSGMNRVDDPVHPGRSLYGFTGLVPRGEEKMSMSGFSESVLGFGSGEKSTSRKFQWDKLFVDDKPVIASSNRISYGGFCDSGAVTAENSGRGSSIACYNQRIKAYESSRNYGVIDGSYASLRGRSSIAESEGDKNIHFRIDNKNTFRDNMMNERRGMSMSFENDTFFAENVKNIVDCRSLNVNPVENQDSVEFSFQRNDHGFSVCEGVERMPILFEENESSGNSCHRVLSLEEAMELGLEQNRIDKQKIIGLMNEGNRINNQKLVLPFDWNAFEDAEENEHRNFTAEEIEQLAMLEDSRQELYRGRSGTSIDDMAIDRNSFYSEDVLSMPRHSSNTGRPYKSNVMQRLGRVLSVKQRLGHPPQVGKRQMTSTYKKKYPWVKQLHEKTLDDHEQNKFPDSKRKKHLKTEPKKYVKTKSEEYAKTEPEEHGKSEPKEYAKAEAREDSEEFTNQVQKSFLKIYKILNENSADLRIYLEQDGVGRLKCCICGSSKEFVDAAGLAQHAFFACKSRTDHMGLYKAICVLMGWNSTNAVNGTWIRQILPSAEASSLREDLIIWPPVVLIHNSFIANDNKDKHMTVSIEGLKLILKGMGCERMINICRGKASYQSSMVVNFSGTYSGLCEAKKLHKLFSEKQRGRAEFEQISSNGYKRKHQETQNILVDDKTNHQETRTTLVYDETNHQVTQYSLVDDKTNHQETQNIPVVDRTNHQETPDVLVVDRIDDRTNHRDTENVLVNDTQSFLYGYMGIASDLDLLDSNTKRRSVVKSKRDIEATADASFKPQ